MDMIRVFFCFFINFIFEAYLFSNSEEEFINKYLILYIFIILEGVISYGGKACNKNNNNICRIACFN